jgi:filamentous hemagglutinin family protein
MKPIAPWLCFVSSFAVCFVAMPSAIQAQIIPDATLPTNSSVDAGCTRCTIEAGTVRGVNLFHSFREFSIPTGGEARFNNSSQIQNILTRVTGSNVSNIDGLISANGTANLFLLNPNGIIFGPNARLQIGGSFSATTASRFQFPDGSEFSATNPQAPPLLTINVPIGLQYGPNVSATIANRGNLVAGEDLTLAGGNLDLQGQLQAGRDLTLNAETEVRIRDTVTEPFLARSGRNLTIQGNQKIDILTLNHLPQTPFVSGGNIALISNTPIAADAHFTSRGGNFSVQTLAGTPGSLISRFDPIFDIAGDVAIGFYFGPSLQVTAGGDITYQDIWISAIDPLVNPDQPALILTAGGNITGTGQVLTLMPEGNLLVRFTSGGNVTLTPGSGITTDADGGKGGDIFIQAAGTVDINNAVLRFRAFGETDGGTLDIKAQALTVRNNASFEGDVNANATGRGGNIRLDIAGSLLLDGQSEFGIAPTGESTRITVGVLGGGIGPGGTVQIKAGSLVMQNGAIIKNSTQGSGNAGNIQIDANQVAIAGFVSLDQVRGGLPSGLFTTTSTNARAGDIVINANSFQISDGAILSARKSPLLGLEGNATTVGGNITINATGSLTLASGGQIITSTYTNRPAGNIQIKAGQIAISGSDPNYAARQALIENLNQDPGVEPFLANNILNGANSGIFANAETGSTGNGGSIAIATDTLLLSDQAQISSRLLGGGNAGDIDIIAQDITLQQQSRLTNSVGVTGIGKGGNLTLNTKKLLVSSGSTISSSTSGVGNAGTIQIGNADLIRVIGNSAIATETIGTGLAGGINLSSRQLALGDRAKISVSTTSTNPNASGGDLQVAASQISLAGNSSISADTAGSASGGNVRLQPFGTDPTLIMDLPAGSQISASTTGNGNGGTVTAIAPGSIQINGNGKIATETNQNGSAGGIDLTTPELILTNAAQLSASTNSNNPNATGGDFRINVSQLTLGRNSTLSADTTGSASGGNIVLQPFATESDLNIDFQPGSRISASTAGGGKGGTISAIAPRSITLSGNGTLAAETTGSGGSGNLSFSTGRLTVQNQAQASVSGRGTGVGGNLAITANLVQLDRQGRLIAETTSGDGGNITLNLRDNLTLRRNSLISATAGTAQSGGNGGNITINVPQGFVIGVLKENSDIRANAFTGNGGKIEITAQGIFGLRFQPQDTPFSDITASSQFGFSGQVILNLLNVDPSRGLIPLAVNPIDPTQRIVLGCSSNSQQGQKNSRFVVTGKGGLPASPDEMSTGETPLIAPIDLIFPHAYAPSSPHPPTSPLFPSSTHPPTQIIEAQGWIIAADGTVYLTAQPSISTANPGWQPIPIIQCPKNATIQSLF